MNARVNMRLKFSMNSATEYLLRTLPLLGFPSGSDGKESACSVGDLGSIPGSGRSPGEKNGYNFSVLACRMPWTEEPCELQSMRLQKSGTQLRDQHFYFSLSPASLTLGLGVHSGDWRVDDYQGISL